MSKGTGPVVDDNHLHQANTVEEDRTRSECIANHTQQVREGSGCNQEIESLAVCSVPFICVVEKKRLYVRIHSSAMQQSQRTEPASLAWHRSWDAAVRAARAASHVTQIAHSSSVIALHTYLHLQTTVSSAGCVANLITTTGDDWIEEGAWVITICRQA